MGYPTGFDSDLDPMSSDEKSDSEGKSETSSHSGNNQTHSSDGSNTLEVSVVKISLHCENVQSSSGLKVFFLRPLPGRNQANRYMPPVG